jgi:hypothetical protein
VILPWNNLLGAWGKDRAYYIMNRDHLGGFTPGDNAIAQYAPGMTAAENPPTLPQDPANDPARTGHIHCAPVMFDDPKLGPILTCGVRTTSSGVTGSTEQRTRLRRPRRLSC